jgi:hypothetical protein
MLSKINRRILTSQLKPGYNFGSHGKVVLDKNAAWLTFRTSRKLMAFDGIKDTHIQAPPAPKDDPFLHIKNNGMLSMENLVYNDAYYHDPDHELHVTEPHGYIKADDPLDHRFDAMSSSILAIGLITVVLIVVVYINPVECEAQKRIDRRKIVLRAIK